MATKDLYFNGAVRNFVDFDYTSELPEAEREWLAAFAQEYYGDLRYAADSDLFATKGRVKNQLANDLAIMNNRRPIGRLRTLREEAKSKQLSDIRTGKEAATKLPKAMTKEEKEARKKLKEALRHRTTLW